MFPGCSKHHIHKLWRMRNEVAAYRVVGTGRRVGHRYAGGVQWGTVGGTKTCWWSARPTMFPPRVQFTPNKFDASVGQKVTFKVTNKEQWS
jgi:hypothetical protein